MIEQDLTKIGCHGNWRRYKNNPILKDDWGETFDVTVAAVSFVTYLIAGFVRNALIMLVIGFALMVATLYVIKQIAGNKQTA